SYDLLRTSSLIEATAATHCHPLSLHDALPICTSTSGRAPPQVPSNGALSIRSGGIRVLMSSSDKECGSTAPVRTASPTSTSANRSEEHTSELQSRENLVCRLLLEKKNMWPRDL